MYLNKENKSQRTKKYTLASRLSQRLNQSLQESIFFSTQKSNSIFFLPSLRCFNFFANAQPMTDKHFDSSERKQKVVQLATDDRTPSANRVGGSARD